MYTTRVETIGRVVSPLRAFYLVGTSCTLTLSTYVALADEKGWVEFLHALEGSFLKVVCHK